MKPLFRPSLVGVLRLLAAASVSPAGAAVGPVVVRVSDWAVMPFSGNVSTATGNPGYMARVNFLKEEPGGTGRMWTCDLNGNLHIFDKAGTPATRSAQMLAQAAARTAYLDFNGQSATADPAEKANVPNAAGTSTSQQAPNGLFPLFTKKSGYANGLVTFEFDPAFESNGRFYTVHIEATSSDGAAGRLPVTTKFPGFNAAGYTTTAVVHPAGAANSDSRHAVLVEWTDSNLANATFEGTARELLRIRYNGRIHPLGDIAFHPTAQPGDPEWGVMYLASGDGGAGESNATGDDGFPWLSSGDRHFSPQRLDSLVGKILRIIPDLSLHGATSSLSANGRYRIPDDNPFTDSVTFPGARKEVWTLGHRNPHRFFWITPPGDPSARMLAVTEIGLHAWEEVNLLKAGKNYGYAEREGPQALVISTSSGSNQTMAPLPSPDTLPVQLTANTFAPGGAAPEYPVIAYPHDAAHGDAISSGFVYQGAAIPALHGKFVFGDITTGRLFCCDPADMFGADDGTAATTAAIQPVELLWDDPNDSPDLGVQAYDRFFEIAEKSYDARGGLDLDLPGGATISGTGRADIRIAVDAAGELFVTSKSDGMIRSLGAVPPPVFTTQPADQWIAAGADAGFTAAATGTPAPDLRWQRLPADGGGWQDLADDSVCSGTRTATLQLEDPGNERSGDRYRCVASCSGTEAYSTEAVLELKTIPNTWLSAYFSTAERANRVVAGDLADPDRDGLVNLLEYAFAFDPEKDSSQLMPKLVKSGANATLAFPVPRTATLDYRVEASTDLTTWSTSGVTLSTAAGTMTASYPMTPHAKAFLRIGVVAK